MRESKSLFLAAIIVILTMAANGTDVAQAVAIQADGKGRGGGKSFSQRF